jgi:hypothetical protein
MFATGGDPRDAIAPFASEITISTRRLSWRPAGLVLLATG